MSDRRSVITAAAIILLPRFAGGGLARAATPSPAEAELDARFEQLSTNGNSNCSRAFMEGISTLPRDARLQGSCCSPMDRHRYGEQVEGLKTYAAVEIIPADPYDIEAGLAADLMAAYDLELTPGQQAAYDYAMENSDEGGPCCCQCWRWRVYGGLAKLLIRDHGFTGEQVTQVWDFSDGCGGAGEHAHG